MGDCIDQISSHIIDARDDDVELHLCLGTLVGSDVAIIISQKIVELIISEPPSLREWYSPPRDTNNILARCRQDSCYFILSKRGVWVNLSY